MKSGPEHGNYQHGRYAQWDYPDTFCREALVKDLLQRILTTPCNARGELPFSSEEQAWAMRVCREKPDWARNTLRCCGIPVEEQKDEAETD